MSWMRFDDPARKSYRDDKVHIFYLSRPSKSNTKTLPEDGGVAFLQRTSISFRTTEFSRFTDVDDQRLLTLIA